MQVKRFKVKVWKLCKTYWRTHGCARMPGHEGKHVCECGEVCGREDIIY